MKEKVEKSQKKLADVQFEMADIKLLVLRRQMNPHFMFNSLNAIQHFITINDQWRALKYLSKFSKLMRLVLENAETDKLYLSDEIKILHLYLALEAMRFDKKFDYEINIPADTDLMNIKIPFLLILPFVEKAINHGLFNKKGKGQLQIVFHQKNDHLHCVVEDNGIGRRRAREIVGAKKVSDPSDALMKKCIEWMNLQGKFKTKLMTEDLYTADKIPAGTRVELTIPLVDE